jgi:hypothetical protein
MKVALFNDTGAFAHIGCQAVSDAHARMLGRRGHEVTQRFFIDWPHGLTRPHLRESVSDLLSNEEFRSRIEAVDAVVVNGEGTVHHGAGLHLLAILGAAQELGKQTLLVNAVYEASFDHEDIIRKLTDFTVRDQHSLDFAKSRSLRARLVLDSCFEAEFSAGRLADMSGKTALSDWHWTRSDVGAVMRLYAMQFHESTFYFPFERADASTVWRGSLATMATAELLISARHHGVCFAAKARVPFVALPSNTSKIEGFLQAVGIDMPVAKSFSGLKSSVSWARAHRDVFDRLFDKVDQMLPLTTFDALGGSVDPHGEAREVARLQADLAAHAASSLINGEWETYAISRRFHDCISPAVEPSDDGSRLNIVRLKGILGGYR